MGLQGIPRRLGSALFLQTETIIGNTFGQDGTGRGWRRGGGSFSWVVPSRFQRSRVSPHPVSNPDPLPPRQRWQSRPQAPFHPACNSFLPPRASHLKKESDGRRGREIVIFSSPRWTEVTLQLERKPNTASSSPSESTERRGQRGTGG